MEKVEILRGDINLSGSRAVLHYMNMLEII